MVALPPHPNWPEASSCGQHPHDEMSPRSRLRPFSFASHFPSPSFGSPQTVERTTVRGGGGYTTETCLVASVWGCGAWCRPTPRTLDESFHHGWFTPAIPAAIRLDTRDHRQHVGDSGLSPARLPLTARRVGFHRTPDQRGVPICDEAHREAHAPTIAAVSLDRTGWETGRRDGTGLHLALRRNLAATRDRATPRRFVVLLLLLCLFYYFFPCVNPLHLVSPVLSPPLQPSCVSKARLLPCRRSREDPAVRTSKAHGVSCRSATSRPIGRRSTCRWASVYCSVHPTRATVAAATSVNGQVLRDDGTVICGL